MCVFLIRFSFLGKKKRCSISRKKIEMSRKKPNGKPAQSSSESDGGEPETYVVEKVLAKRTQVSAAI